MKKFLSVVLAVIMVLSLFSVMGFAADDSVTAKFLSYNVAGLPNINYILGKDDRDVSSNQSSLGKQLESSDYDVIGVQEDFIYHDLLVANMDSYKFKTAATGFLGGDGLNVYSRNARIYNANRVAWEVVGGPISDGDILTPKGFIHTILDLGNGITVDFYDLHADAFDGDDNALARKAQYNQLLDYINVYSVDRPVIITGDFNTSLHIKNSGDNAADEEAMLDVFHNRGGFKDAWIEQYNGGNTSDFSSWQSSGVSYWGNWDSVEKYYYRNGGGIEIEASDFNYVNFFNGKDENLSDHSAAECTFTFTKTADFQPDTRSLSVKHANPMARLMNAIKWFFKDLITVFRNWDEVKGYIGL